jgi:hypothetical protein
MVPAVRYEERELGVVMVGCGFKFLTLCPMIYNISPNSCALYVTRCLMQDPVNAKRQYPVNAKRQYLAPCFFIKSLPLNMWIYNTVSLAPPGSKRQYLLPCFFVKFLPLNMWIYNTILLASPGNILRSGCKTVHGRHSSPFYAKFNPDSIDFVDLCFTASGHSQCLGCGTSLSLGI